MTSLIEAHEANTDAKVTTVVADSQYGTKENLLACHDKEIKAHVPVIKLLNENISSRKGIFGEERFIYSPETDTLTCPVGKILKKRVFHENIQNIEYAASKKDCSSCSLRSQCTRSKGPRSIQRNIRHEDLQSMLTEAKTSLAIQDLKTRKHLMERSFARNTRFGFDRARWRGLWKVAIQEYLVASIQNIQTLIRYTKNQVKGVLGLFATGAIKDRSQTMCTRLYSVLIIRTDP